MGGGGTWRGEDGWKGDPGGGVGTGWKGTWEDRGGGVEPGRGHGTKGGVVRNQGGDVEPGRGWRAGVHTRRSGPSCRARAECT